MTSNGYHRLLERGRNLLSSRGLDLVMARTSKEGQGAMLFVVL
jgi:hypothetical protein